MAMTSFAPEEFFGGAKSVSMNGPKFSKSDRTMKAFSFVERNKQMIRQMAIARALTGSWTFGDPNVSFDGTFSLLIFYV